MSSCVSVYNAGKNVDGRGEKILCVLVVTRKVTFSFLDLTDIDCINNQHNGIIGHNGHPHPHFKRF